MHNFPPLILAPAFAVLFFWLCTALGRRFLALTRLAPQGLHGAESLLLEITLGIGVMQVLPISLGLFGVLSPVSVRIGVLALALALGPDLWRVARDVGNTARRLLVRRPSGLALTWIGLVVALLGLLLIHALFLGFTDDDGYHLAAPWRWLREGTLSYLPSYTHTNAGLAFEMSYLIALAFNAVLGAKLLHYGTGVLLLLATLMCARRIGTLAVGATVVSLLMVSTPLNQTPLLFTLAYSDFPACLSVMVAIMLWAIWRETHEQKLLWCIALCAGFTASFKFTALAVLGAWAVLVALELRTRGRHLLPGFIDLVKFGLIAVLPTLPWFARNWYLTGNPLYPMAATLIPSRDWSAEQGAVFNTYIKYYSWGVASGAGMDMSMRKLLILMTIVGVFAGSALLYWLLKDRKLRILLCFSSAYVLVCIVLTGLIFRYWLPGVICMLLVLCTAAARKMDYRFPRASLRYAPAIILMIVALGVQARQEIQKGVLLRDFRVATGISSHRIETENDPMEQTWRFIQRNTPEDARFLAAAFYSTFGASSYGCFRAQRYCLTTDSHLQTYIDFTSWPAFLQSLKRANVQYMLLSDQQFTPNRQGFSYRASDNEYPFSVRMAQTAGTKVFQAGHIQVYRLNDLDAVESTP